MRTQLINLSCLVAGLACGFGFGVFYRSPGWVIVPLALSILFVFCKDVTPRRAALLGFIFGLGQFGAGLSWTYLSLHNYGGLPLFLAVFIAGIFVIFLALFPALACFLGKWRTSQQTTSFLVFLKIAVAWTLIEYVRSVLFTGFGWLAVGYSQVPRSPLTGFFPIIGTFGATFLVTFIAACITQSFYVSTTRKSIVAYQAVVVILLIAGLGLRRVEFTKPIDEPLTVSVLQGAIPQDDLWLRENLMQIPEIYLDLLLRAEGQLIVAPESALPFRWEQLGDDYKQLFYDILDEQDSTLVIGTFTRPADNPNSQNIALVLDQENTHTYAKRHLTPYGEYLPFSSILEPILKRENIPFSQLSAGSGDGIIELPFATLGMSICYESLFPELFSAPPAELFVTITNDSWFDGSYMPFQHLQIISARALEYGRWVVRASNTGPSAVIRHDGRFKRWMGFKARGRINTQVEKRTGITPYARFGDWPVLIFCILLFACLSYRKT